MRRLEICQVSSHCDRLSFVKPLERHDPRLASLADDDRWKSFKQSLSDRNTLFEKTYSELDADDAAAVRIFAKAVWSLTPEEITTLKEGIRFLALDNLSSREANRFLTSIIYVFDHIERQNS